MASFIGIIVAIVVLLALLGAAAYAGWHRVQFGHLPRSLGQVRADHANRRRVGFGAVDDQTWDSRGYEEEDVGLTSEQQPQAYGGYRGDEG